VSIEALKKELAALNPEDQRRAVAFVVSLQEAQNAEYQASLARKIDDRDPSHFATLEELDRRLGIKDDERA
jgi:hypothetical protein